MLTLFLLFVVIAILLIAVLFNERQVPWATRLVRLNPGKPNQSEWMAPDDIVESVHTQYSESIFWMQDAIIATADGDTDLANKYLSGTVLIKYHNGKKRSANARIVGVLRANHNITIRHFEESGEECLLVDFQTECRMATYDQHTGKRISTQNMRDSTQVYRMKYDRTDKRWKIHDFVQTLPPGWEQPQYGVHLLSNLTLPAGYDS